MLWIFVIPLKIFFPLLKLKILSGFRITLKIITYREKKNFIDSTQLFLLEF